MDLIEEHRRAAVAFGSQPLLVLPHGRNVDLATGYIPLLSTYTFEDKAAKGLRKGKIDDQLQDPVFYSALEVVRDNQIVLLNGEAGSGKTTFAKHLCFRIAIQSPSVSTGIARNEADLLKEECWDTAGLVPLYFAIDDAQTLQRISEDDLPEMLAHAAQEPNEELLIILDGIERVGSSTAELLTSIIERISQSDEKNHRLVVLADSSALSGLRLPTSLHQHSLGPLMGVSRRRKLAQLLDTQLNCSQIAVGQAAANPTVFALSLQAEHIGNDAEKTVDAWLSRIIPDETEAEKLGSRTLRAQLNESSAAITLPGDAWPALLRKTQTLLAARHMSTLHVDRAAEFAVKLLRSGSFDSGSVICSLLERLRPSSRKLSSVASAILQSTGSHVQRGALRLAPFGAKLTPALQDQIVQHATTIIEEIVLPFEQREEAGRVLSLLGDPRDLTALAMIPAGSTTMGSDTHLNSQPVHQVSVDSFRIGTYPVIVRDYLIFVKRMGRCWLSPDQHDPRRQNVPATDLTWYDAVAYCGWLTGRWREVEKISGSEEVRLPTESEWERAARGTEHQGIDHKNCVCPWGNTWKEDSCNSEETGLNNTCTVGLFPYGRSPYGCHDMAGNIWEWCSTLWGENMTTPSFRYPWKPEDGRETHSAPANVRRVLRGGCFSSGKLKANCTYRGSLEPNGYWRGNGFRIVVADCE